MAVLPSNYSVAILFLSAGLIPFEHVLTPGLQAAIGTDRLVAIAIGAALAFIGGHVLWPGYERRALPDLLRTCTEAMAAYADAVIGAAQGEAAGDMQAERRGAGLALSNLQVGVQHALTEIGGEADATTAILWASTALQCLSNTLNTLLHTAAAIAPTCLDLAAFRAAFVPAVADPRKGYPPSATLRADIPNVDRWQDGTRLSQGLERLTSALEMLRVACPGMSFRSKTAKGENREPSD